jgi:methionyl-tRNA synthetase
MGHAFEKVVSDTYARWYRFIGFDTYFVTGTDENGQKLLEAAQKQGKETQQFVDENTEIFRKLCNDLNITHQDFIRTTEERHKEVCQDLWKTLEQKGDLYFGKYSGQYCMSCENFYTELQAPDGQCPHHHSHLQLKEEDGYFFKMSQYQDWILTFLKENQNFIVPKSSYNEILSRLEKDKIRDVAFSRPNLGWGIPVPGKENDFVMYTWCDALVNYYSAVKSKNLDEKYWPCDMHVIGKDIAWFHCVIWPCMLHAAGIELPKQVYVHGMILSHDGRKMSKSLGNVIDPYEMMNRYPLDSFKYYLLRGIPAQGDGAFVERELVDKHNNELGNDYGNLIMRVIKLSLKHLPAQIDGKNIKQDVDFQETFAKMKTFMEKREHGKALDTLWEAVNKANQYVNDKEPWKLKNDHEKLKAVIYNCLYSIESLAHLLSPYLPWTSENTLKSLGSSANDWNDLKFGDVHYNLTTPEALFPKIEYQESSSC